MRRIALAALLVCCACSSLPPGPYLHAASGIELPEHAGELTLERVFPSAEDLGKNAETAHYEAPQLKIARISLTIRPASSAHGDPTGELAFSTARFALPEQTGAAAPDAYELLGATRPAARAHIDLGKGSLPDHVDVIVVPWRDWVIEGRLYHRK